jgi:hypothetical protein
MGPWEDKFAAGPTPEANSEDSLSCLHKTRKLSGVPGISHRAKRAILIFGDKIAPAPHQPGIKTIFSRPLSLSPGFDRKRTE